MPRSRVITTSSDLEAILGNTPRRYAGRRTGPAIVGVTEIVRRESGVAP
jgi:hypothetical protein